MPYSAGDIYVQVVPSFRNTQRLINAWVRSSGIADLLNAEVNKGLGGADDAAGAQGRRAGRRFGDEFGREANRSSSKAGDDAGSAFASRFNSRVNNALRALPKAKLDVDSTEADKAIEEIRARLLALRDAEIGVDIESAEAMRELDRLAARMHQLSGSGLDIDVEVDLASALAEVAAFVTWVNRQRATIDVRVDHHNTLGFLSSLTRSLHSTRNETNGTANAFRAFNGILFTATTIGPALIPILGVLGGTLAALAPAAVAAGAGLGVLGLSLSGLSKGTNALAKQTEEIRAFGKATAATTKAVKLQMTDLGPAGAEMARAMSGFREGYLRDLKMMNQAKILPGLKSLVKDLSTYRNAFRNFTLEVSAAWTDVFRNMGRWVTSTEMKTFFETIRSMSPAFTKQTADILMNVGTGLAGILTAFAPLSQGVGDAILSFSKSFAEWGTSLKNTEGFRKFVEWLGIRGPQVFALLGAAINAVLNMLIGIDPFVQPLLALLTGIFNWISNTDAETIGSLTFAVLALVVAFQSAAAAAALFGFIKGLVMGEIVLLIAGIILIAGALVIFWQNSETFRNVVGAAWEWLKEKALQVWPVIEQAIKAVMQWITEVGWPKLQQVISYIGNAFTWLWETILRPVFNSLSDFAAVVVQGLAWAWEKVLWPALQGTGAIIGWLWNTILWPFFEWVAGAVKTLGEVIGWLWVNVIDPAFRAIGGVIAWVWTTIIEPVLGWIGQAIALTGQVIAFTWENVIRPALEWLGKAFTWLWENIIQPVANFVMAAISILGQVIFWIFNNIVIPIVWLVGTIVFKVFRNTIVGAFNVVMAIVRVFAGIIVWLWEHVVQPVITWIGEHWDTFAAVFKFIYDHTIGPVIQGFMDKFELIKGVFASVVKFIGDNWSSIVELIKKPIRFVVETILNNGLIEGFNKVAGWFGSDKLIGKIPTGWLDESPAQNTWGGSAGRFGEGGPIPGRFVGPKADNVLIHANPREFMQPVASHEYYGTPVMEAMRRRAIPREIFAGFGVNTPPPRGNRLAEGGQPDTGFSIMDVFKGPAAWLEGIVSGLFSTITGSNLGQMLIAIPKKIIGWMVEKVQSFFGGGLAGDVPMASPGGIVNWKGHRFNELMVQRMMLAEKLANTLFLITQGSFSTSVSASGSTHAGGGAADYWPMSGGPDNTVRASRMAQIAAWWRKPNQGPWGNHIHGIAIGDPSASPAAQAQVRSYLSGGNGLGGRDDGPRLFDTGGWLPPGMWQVANLTGKHEAILTAEQWDSVRKRLSGSGDTITVNSATYSTAEEIAGEVLRAKRKIRIRGRY